MLISCRWGEKSPNEVPNKKENPNKQVLMS